MSDYDAVVIGAGHNGLTAAAIMARGGMRVLCLEKNHFIGGMSSNTELMRGYQFELAGSIQFPVPNEIFEDLGFDQCPIYEPEVQSATIGTAGEPPVLLYSDPERLLAHLGDVLGLDAVMGMAEVAAWADAPARAIGRFDVRKPPKSLDEMWACAANESERQAIGTAMFGSVMDVVDRFLPDRHKHAQIRSMLSFLAVNSTYLGPYTPGSALCLAFALASPGNATMSKVRGGIGAMADHLRRLFEQGGGELRRHVKVAKIVVSEGHVKGVMLGDGEVVTAPVVVSNLDPTATFTQLCSIATISPRPSCDGSKPSTTERRTSRSTSPSTASPSSPALTPSSTRAACAATSRSSGQRNRCSWTTRTACGDSYPSLRRSIWRSRRSKNPRLAPQGKHAGAAASPSISLSRRTIRSRRALRDEMASRIVAKVAKFAPNFPDLIERQFNYPAYTYELMFGCTGRRLHPRPPSAPVHGPLPSRALVAGPTTRCPSAAYICAVRGATVGPG